MLQARSTLRPGLKYRFTVPDSARINAMHPRGNPTPGPSIKVIE
jgi:hypothetical protein